MDGINVSEMISNMGFPIVCCIAMFWFIQKTMAQQQTLLDDINKSLQNQTATMTQLLITLNREKQ